MLSKYIKLTIYMHLVVKILLKLGRISLYYVLDFGRIDGNILLIPSDAGRMSWL